MFKYLNHLVISKFVMAITGIILVLFITGHALGNLQIFLGKEALNAYAAFLQGLGEILWVERIGLLVAALLHIITSIYLKLYNNNARPDKYVVTKYLKAKLNSRTMIWTGVMIAVFVIYHLLHFTVGIIQPENYQYKEVYTKNAYSIQYQQNSASFDTQSNIDDPNVSINKVVFERHDVYKMVILGFRNPLISGFYILAVILLGIHLSHAIQSFFQTLGWNNPKYFGWIQKFSVAYGYFIAIVFLSVPLSVLLGLIGGNI